MTDTTTTPAPAPAPARRKPHRVFMWTFLATQALFVMWLTVGLATAHTGPDTAQLAALCGKGAWQGLFTSYHDCVVHGGHGLTEAADVGEGIGVALIIGLWIATDVILGIGRLIVLTARRR